VLAKYFIPPNISSILMDESRMIIVVFSLVIVVIILYTGKDKTNN
jgi:hypothetical protein